MSRKFLLAYWLLFTASCGISAALSLHVLAIECAAFAGACGMAYLVQRQDDRG